jgi:predicted amidophosphoribosyltransferase
MDALREFLESRGIPFEEQAAPERDITKLTLVRPSWNKKRTVRFLSIRKWSARHHHEAVEAMKFAKARLDEQVLTQAASEVAGAVRDMGMTGGMLVTAPPAGASPVDRHFGTELAKRVAQELGAQYASVFEPRPRAKGSHPRHYAERGEIKLAPGAPKGAYLLVDDVSSTGHTIEHCVKLLREQGTAVAVAWIYEEAA